MTGCRVCFKFVFSNVGFALSLFLDYLTMATIFAVYNSQGCIGRCDAKCHEAERPECDCICGGLYHGKSGIQACNDRHVLTDDQIFENCKALGIEGVLRIVRPDIQMELFA